MRVTLSLDHDAFERNRSNADNVIDSKVLERDWREKPVPTFSLRALVVAEIGPGGIVAKLHKPWAGARSAGAIWRA
ncbi:hypothetical protein DSM21852_00430 [Methylocystis bryophila]|uniref:Uncharacterized protein n=1 Tax=Methylocystis bryophila TaxID=655015 RepID=A0A1W6MTT0_9HYPH|nr:hypothetical protein B1812_07210 [Methylocystis bryophila]BDV36790.1 hypothetical protein DSM21852_00430 [Methylocystis bryophila]